MTPFLRSVNHVYRRNGVKNYTGDYVILDSVPPVNMVNTPEIEGGIGTMAMIMNCIPHCINAAPGLKTMIDIPVPHAIMGDFRDLIDEDKKIVK